MEECLPPVKWPSLSVLLQYINMHAKNDRKPCILALYTCMHVQGFQKGIKTSSFIWVHDPAHGSSGNPLRFPFWLSERMWGCRIKYHLFPLVILCQTRTLTRVQVPSSVAFGLWFNLHLSEWLLVSFNNKWHNFLFMYNTALWSNLSVLASPAKTYWCFMFLHFLLQKRILHWHQLEDYHKLLKIRFSALTSS